MAGEQQISLLIERYRRGDSTAAQPLWETYFHRLLGLARKLMPADARSKNDEEDVAISAIKSAIIGIRDGKFPRLNDSSDLWALLAAITRNKAIDANKSAIKKPVAVSDSRIELLIDAEPTPEMAAEFTDEVRHLLAMLDDGNLPKKFRGKKLQEIALAKLHRCTNKETAAKLGFTISVVEKSLATIRTIWRRR